jgi:hypothetical protein
MRQANKFYWLCQICGWGAYSVVGLWTAVLDHGWKPSAVYGYILFFLYNIALTVAFNFKWRWLSELFGVVFQDYVA